MISFTKCTGIRPSKNIAGATRNDKFAGAIINQATQVLYMDKWTHDSRCCCEDTKRILKGKEILIVEVVFAFK